MAVDKNGPDDSIEFPAEDAVQRIGKYAGAIAGILALVGTIVAVPIWLTTELEAVETVSKAYTDSHIEKALESHAEHPHAKSVPREIFEEHVRQQEQDNADAKSERKEIRKMLDLIGERTYRSPSKWEDSKKEEGLRP